METVGIAIATILKVELRRMIRIEFEGDVA